MCTVLHFSQKTLITGESPLCAAAHPLRYHEHLPLFRNECTSCRLRGVCDERSHRVVAPIRLKGRYAHTRRPLVDGAAPRLQQGEGPICDIHGAGPLPNPWLRWTNEETGARAQPGECRTSVRSLFPSFHTVHAHRTVTNRGKCVMYMVPLVF